MAVQKPIATQPENRNFLAPTGFRFQVNRAPTVSYFGNRVNIPSMTMGVANFNNYLNNIPLPGTNIDFEDLTLYFLVDEDLQNYMEIQTWIRGIGFPESLQEIYRWQNLDEAIISQPYGTQLNLYSDGTLTILDSQQKPSFKVKFENLFPTNLSTLEFDAQQTDLQYFTASVSFKYTIYHIEPITTCC